MNKTEDFAKAIYIGRRLRGDKLSQVFLIGKKEICFSGVKWVHVGYCYPIKKDEKGDPSTIASRPDPIHGEEVTDETKLERWRLAEETDLQKRKLQLSANRSSKSKSIEKVIELLKPVAEDMDFSEIQALLSRVGDALDRHRNEIANRKFHKQIRRLMKTKGLK